MQAPHDVTLQLIYRSTPDTINNFWVYKWKLKEKERKRK